MYSETICTNTVSIRPGYEVKSRQSIVTCTQKTEKNIIIRPIVGKLH